MLLYWLYSRIFFSFLFFFSFFSFLSPFFFTFVEYLIPKGEYWREKDATSTYPTEFVTVRSIELIFWGVHLSSVDIGRLVFGNQHAQNLSLPSHFFFVM